MKKYLFFCPSIYTLFFTLCINFTSHADMLSAQQMEQLQNELQQIERLNEVPTDNVSADLPPKKSLSKNSNDMVNLDHLFQNSMPENSPAKKN